ncbi:MAG: RsmE family RNA methyltransferase [Thermoanaerobaculia bacterium]|nr:RsmE family RNA methyltransferase [Thermoanaerobaculia bacterium]
MRTVVVSGEALATPELTLTGEAYRHLFRSARQARGDRLRLVDGCGTAREGEIVDVDRHQAMVRVGGPLPPNEPSLFVDLRVAAPKGNRAGWLVEKTTEMGVGAVRFFRSGRGPRSYGTSTLGRLQRVARSAVEQSHRSRVPRVEGMLELRACLADLRPGAAFHLDPGATASWPRDLPSSVVVMVGPEGGFRRAELEALEGAGSTGVRLGATVLRVETAAVAAVACLLQAAPGRWGE